MSVARRFAVAWNAAAFNGSVAGERLRKVGSCAAYLLPMDTAYQPIRPTL